jgi:membrane protein DedA with SNARE-associated domain
MNSELIQQLSQHPLLQGVVAALATFILEDPTTIGCGLLVADQKMAFMTALVGLTLGIAAGDVGLYLVGRAASAKTVKWGLISEDRLGRAKRWLDRNLLFAITVSRFVPGMRLPTYLGAGIFQASFWRFVGIALAASLVWTLLLLSVTVRLGEAALPMLGRFKWLVAAGLIAVIALAQWLIARRQTRDVEELSAEPKPAAEPIVSVFEFWHPAIFYLPVGAYWLWLAARHRSLTLPTAANPSIYSGGLIGESKSQILSLIPAGVRRWFAHHTTIERREKSEAEEIVLAAREAMREAGLEFPIVAKPDLGQRGAGVRRVLHEQHLLDYVREFPEGQTIVLQRLADHPCEAGVLYFRRPGAERGEIFSVTLKHFPRVVGDGRRTLRELILDDPRARIVREIYFRRHGTHLDSVIAEGVEFQLVFAGNHAQGAVFRDGTHLVTPELHARIDEIAREIPEFYFGRFDIRFHSMESFLRGEDFTIVELNGAGAEATHIWDARATLGGAYKTLFRQFEILFEIGAHNRRRGHSPLTAVQVIRDFLRFRKIARRYPPAT